MIKRNSKGQFVKGFMSGENNINYNPDLHKEMSVECACGCGTIIHYKLIDIKYEDRNKPRCVHGHNLRLMTKKQHLDRIKKYQNTRKNNGKKRTTKIYKLIKVSKEYKDWHKQVFERDNYTCQHCGKRGGYLHAHHLKPFAFLYKEAIILIDENDVWQKVLEYKPLFDIENGQTLCRKCHYKVDHPHYQRWRDKPPKGKNGYIK